MPLLKIMMTGYSKLIQKALDKWKAEGLLHAIIEITDSGLYEEPLQY